MPQHMEGLGTERHLAPILKQAASLQIQLEPGKPVLGSHPSNRSRLLTATIIRAIQTVESTGDAAEFIDV
jgi:hypothetical protein